SFIGSLLGGTLGGGAQALSSQSFAPGVARSRMEAALQTVPIPVASPREAHLSLFGSSRRQLRPFDRLFRRLDRGLLRIDQLDVQAKSAHFLDEHVEALRNA